MLFVNCDLVKGFKLEFSNLESNACENLEKI